MNWAATITFQVRFAQGLPKVTIALFRHLLVLVRHLMEIAPGGDHFNLVLADMPAATSTEIMSATNHQWTVSKNNSLPEHNQL